MLHCSMRILIPGVQYPSWSIAVAHVDIEGCRLCVNEWFMPPVHAGIGSREVHASWCFFASDRTRPCISVDVRVIGVIASSGGFLS